MDITLGLGLIKVNDFLLFLVVLGIAIYYYATWDHKLWESQGIPGPKPKPFVGTMLPFFKTGFWNDLNLIKKYGKLVGIFEGNQPGLLIADTEFLKHVLVKDFHATGARREFHTDTFFDHSLVVAEGEKWKMLRSLISPTFTSGKMKAMVPEINECAMGLVGNLEKEVKQGKDFDIRLFTGRFTLDTIASVAFGIKVDAQKEEDNVFHTTINKLYGDFVDLANPVMAVFFMFPMLSKLLAKMGQSWPPREAQKFFSDVVEQTLKLRDESKETRKDFISLISTAHKEKSEDDKETSKRPLTLDEIKGQALTFFDAGYDTTATTLAFMTHSLAVHPNAQEKAHAEIMSVVGDSAQVDYEQVSQLSYLECCIQETLRLYPPGARMDRRATEDITIRGVRIPKGTILVFSPFAMHRMEEYFPEPDKFKPERFEDKKIGYLDTFYYLPFGGGPRSCIGNRLALLELKIAAVHMLRKFKFQRTEKTKVPPELGVSVVMKEKNGTWLKAELRS